MKTPLFISIFFLVEAFAFKQEAYRFIHEYVVLNSSNPKLVQNIHINSYKFNRTATAIDASFDILNPIDSTYVVTVTGYQFRSNEYRRGPIHFNLNVCSLIVSKDFDIPGIIAHSNIKACPLPKGHYYLKQASPDAHTYPPFIPAGKWMLELMFLKEKEFLGTLQWYLRIVYD